MMYTLTNLENLMLACDNICNSQSVTLTVCNNIIFTDNVFQIRVKFVLKYENKSRMANYILISDRICDPELKNATIAERIQSICQELKSTD